MTDRLANAVAELIDALREEARAEAASPRTPDRLLSIAEASAALGGIGRTLVYGEIAAGRLRSCKVGRRRLIPESAIGEYTAR